MSAMAEILLAMGHRVSGSDLHDEPILDRLRGMGATVRIGHDAAHVTDADLVASSTAVPPDNVELQAAAALGIRRVSRPELQGAIARTRRPIAISGTHGKTTTTALAVNVLSRCGADPSYMIGASLGGELGSARLGAGEWFVVEGDESDGTFLELGAEIAVLTNVDADHLDRWGSVDALEAAFDRFLATATATTIVCADDPVAARLGRRNGSVSAGTAEEADWRIIDVVTERNRTRFGLVVPDGDRIEVDLPLAGLHNARNAALAVVLADTLGLPRLDVVRALGVWPGLERRFEVRGEAGGVTVVDDYAHNPAKVAAVLSAGAAGGWRRVVAVFQPHRYSRTADLWEQFADSFADADVVWITELDPSGEASRPGISGEMIVDAVRGAHPEADIRWAPDRADLVERVADDLSPGDLCLTIGAGDITLVGPQIVAALEARGS